MFTLENGASFASLEELKNYLESKRGSGIDVDALLENIVSKLEEGL